MRNWARIVMPLAMLGGLALLACLVSCYPSGRVDHTYNMYECTIKRIEGPFWAYESDLKGDTKRLSRFYRWSGEPKTYENRRVFMFPLTDVEKCERNQGENNV